MRTNKQANRRVNYGRKDKSEGLTQGKISADHRSREHET